MASLYPNGVSIFIDSSDLEIFDLNCIYYYITIKNKNIRDETILLGFMHHTNEEIFTDTLINGYQLYLESNNNQLGYLPNVNNNTIDQYFTYQIFSKLGEIYFIDPNNKNLIHHITDYNTMISYNINTNGKILFDFSRVPKRNSLFIQ